MAGNTFTLLRDHCYHQFAELFPSCKLKPGPHETQTPCSVAPLPHPRPGSGHAIPLSAFMTLAILGTSYEQNHAAFVFLCLAYFAEHHVLGAHAGGSRSQNVLFKAA